MNLAKDIFGGILVIFVAGIVALLQNAVRPDRIPLFPAAPATVSENPYKMEAKTTAPVPGSPPATESGAKGDPPSASTLPTQQEIASGTISKDRLKDLIAGGRILLIDARLPEEFEKGHIDGAINVPYERLAEQYERLTAEVPFDKLIVCYCQSVTCEDSENLARELEFMGYKNVIRYKGGWDEWSQPAGSNDASASGQ